MLRIAKTFLSSLFSEYSEISSTEVSNAVVPPSVSFNDEPTIENAVMDFDEVDPQTSNHNLSTDDMPTSPELPSASPKAFNEEYEKFLGGKTTAHDNTDDDVQVLSDEDEDDSTDDARRKQAGRSTATKECSVKLVDINEMVENGEPLAKRARPSDPISVVRKSSNEMNNIFSSNSKLSDSSARKENHHNLHSNSSSSSSSKSKDPMNYFGSGADGAMKLFSAKRESKVTISPVRNKDLPMSSSGSNSSSSNSAMGSVTITKLSTGSSLSIESKDLKTILGAGKSSVGEKDKNRSDSSGKSASRPGKAFENGFRLVAGNHPKLDLVSMDSSKMSKSSMSGHHGLSSSSSSGHRRVRSGSGDSSIRCNKCREVYSTKEARRLHTCNSILDQHFLIEGGDRLKISPSSSKDSSDNSRSSSRADSPLSSLSPTLPCLTPSAMSSTSGSAPTPGFGTVKKIKITPSETSMKPASSSSSSSSTTATSASGVPVKCKLIKDSKDELHIEGRPKLSIVKVPRLECGSGVVGLDRRPNPSSTSNQQHQQQPIVPKLKLSTLPVNDAKRELGREKWLGSAGVGLGGVSKDPLNLGESYKSLKVLPASSEASKKLNFDEKSSSMDATDALSEKSNRKVEVVSSNFGAGKIRIKYGGAPSSSDDPAKSDLGGEKDPAADDGFPFTFSGRPTYSPSRVEPNGNVPTKGLSISTIFHYHNSKYVVCKFFLQTHVFKTLHFKFFIGDFYRIKFSNSF